MKAPPDLGQVEARKSGRRNEIRPGFSRRVKDPVDQRTRRDGPLLRMAIMAPMGKDGRGVVWDRDRHGPSGVREVRGACPMDCPDTCGWVVTVEDGRAVKLAGDKKPTPSPAGRCAAASSSTSSGTTPLGCATPAA